MSDVRESVAESTEMESIRIELELDKQSTTLGAGALRFSRVDNQRDSGLPDIDQNSSELPTFGLNGDACNSPSNLASGSHAAVINKSVVTSPTAGFSPGLMGNHHNIYAPATRRLSFNSLDSGMVEESADLSV